MTIIIAATVDAIDSDPFTVLQGQVVSVNLYTDEGGLIAESVVAPILVLNSQAAYEQVYERRNSIAAVKNDDRPLGIAMPGTYIVRKPQTDGIIGIEVTS